MGKAVLVLDNMPQNCYECKLQIHTPIGCTINRKNADYRASKPDWCPLKEMPEKKVYDKYPIGTLVRLRDDDPENGPHEVVGYKQIHGSDYLIFTDGQMAYVGRVAK